MTIHISWSAQHHDVIQARYPGKWTWEEVWQAKLIGDAMLEQVPWPCGMLIVLDDPMRIPPGVLTNGAQIMDCMHPRMRHVVLVSDNLLVRNLMRLLAGVFPVMPFTLSMVPTIDQAVLQLRNAGFYSARKPELAVVSAAAAAGDSSTYVRV